MTSLIRLKPSFCSNSFGVKFPIVDNAELIKSGPKGIKPSKQTKAAIRIKDSPP